MKYLFALLAALVIAVLPAAPATAADAATVAPQLLLVAAASDLSYCIDELTEAFRQQEPAAQVKVSLGASGNFFAQIAHGAPFDVFMSADLNYPSRLAIEGYADSATLLTYGIGRIALWSLDARLDLSQGMRVLGDARITRLAIANPEVAPYGRAARAALELYGYWDALKPKLVVGENIAQTAQFVQSGNAQIGIVSLVTLRSPRLKEQGSFFLIPDTELAPIEQGAIVTNHGKANALAARFVLFLQSPGARAILQRNGFGLPRERNGSHG